MTRPAPDQADPRLTAWVARAGLGEARLRPLAGGGGTRRYFRIQDRGLVALHGPDPAENLAWLRLGRHLWFKGLPLPRIYEYDLEQGFFLLEDLGGRHLADPPASADHYHQAVALLARLHREGMTGLDPEWCYQTRAYSAAMVATQEVGYFLNSTLIRYLGWERLPRGIRAEARALGRLAAPEAEDRVLMHRDFQGRNLLIKEGRVRIIDWQGARPGSAAYDLASLLEETPSGPLSPEAKEELVSLYVKARGPGGWRTTFHRELVIVGAARLMQALGAYARITLAGKPHFADFMPSVIRSLEERFRSPLLAGFPILRDLVEKAARRLADDRSIDDQPPKPGGIVFGRLDPPPRPSPGKEAVPIRRPARWPAALGPNNHREESMCALVALVGRPNVGKSTLFNRLVGRPLALVDDRPGVTRDRHYSPLVIGDRQGTIIDTGGFDPTDLDPLVNQIKAQALAALDEADLTVLVVDGKDGPTPHDRELANLIRRSGRPYLVAVNKIDSFEKEANVAEFHELGLEGLWPVSAAHGYGLGEFKEALAQWLTGTEAEETAEDAPPRVAVIGRPNAGKSSLINRLAGHERLVVDHRPGTTRDAVDVAIERQGRSYLFVDTAGVRRKGRVDEKLEKLSVMRALKSLDRADIAILVVDALEGLSDQDAHIAGYAHERGRPVILLANKWDAVRSKNETRQGFQRAVELKMAFLEKAPLLTASARTGLRVDDLFGLIDRIMAQYRFRAATAEVNRVIEAAVEAHTPPYAGRERLKFYYATQVGSKPPTFVVFTNKPGSVHFSYQRFLVNRLKEAFGLDLAPVRLILRARSGRRDT